MSRQAREAYRLFRQNRAYPGLHFKRVHNVPADLFRARSESATALGVLDGDAVAWFWIGSHANYDRLLEKL